MTTKQKIVEELYKMRQCEEINEYVHELLLTRTDSMMEIIGKCGSLNEVVRTALYDLDMEPNYTSYGEFMMPISREEALSLYDAHTTAIYLIYPDDTEAICECRADIDSNEFDLHFAVEIDQPQSLIQKM